MTKINNFRKEEEEKENEESEFRRLSFFNYQILMDDCFVYWG